MSPPPRETEIKLEADPRGAEALRAKLAAAYGPAAETHRLVAVYFDTGRQALRKAGLALRVRADGRRRIQTVKRDTVGGAGVVRDEWETEIAGEGPDLPALAATPVAAVLEGTGNDTLAPLFETAIDRTAWVVRDSDGEVEIVLDVGEVRASGAAAPVVEIECELKRGTAEALAGPLRRMAGWDGLRVGVRSKAERGYRLTAGKAPKPAKAEPVVLEPGMTTAAAVQAILRGCIRQFRLNEPLLAETRAPEALHQLRVALRRLRSALSLFAPVLRDEAYDALKERLRAVSQDLGIARDLDVYLHHAVAPEADRHPGQAGATDLLLALQARREAALDTLLAMLDAPAFRRLMLDLVAWIEAGPWLTSCDRLAEARRAQPIEAFAAQLLDARRRVLKRKGRHLRTLSPEARHRVRIAAKKLRYAADFTASLATERRDRARHAAFVDTMEALQTSLGDLNDIEAGRRLASDLALHPGDADAAAAFSAGHLTARTEARIAPLIDQADRHFDDVLDADRFWSRW